MLLGFLGLCAWEDFGDCLCVSSIVVLTSIVILPKKIKQSSFVTHQKRMQETWVRNLQILQLTIGKLQFKSNQNVVPLSSCVKLKKNITYKYMRSVNSGEVEAVADENEWNQTFCFNVLTFSPSCNDGLMNAQ